MELLPPAPRPTWRGRLHTWAFFLAIPAGIILIVRSTHAASISAASIYSASLLCVFGTSAAYHRLARSDRAVRIMRRMDHSMIYVLISGSYVPMCLVALPKAWGIPILSVVGGFGVIGVIIKVTGVRKLQWLGYALYPTMGWLAVVAGPVLVRSVTPWQLACIVGGGIAYSVGFVVFATKRPNPWPRTFGYHEIWHVFTVVAAGLHFTAMAGILAN